MNRVQRRLQVLDLYRRSLRSAARCPRPEHQLQMKLITRMKFRENKDVKDPTTIDNLIKTGEEELASMNYYHNIRESRNNMNAERTVAEEKVYSPSKVSLSLGGTPSFSASSSPLSETARPVEHSTSNALSASTHILSSTESVSLPSKKTKTSTKRSKKSTKPSVSPVVASSSTTAVPTLPSSSPSPSPSPSLPVSVPLTASASPSLTSSSGLIPEDLLEYLSLSIGKLHSTLVPPSSHSLHHPQSESSHHHQYTMLRNITLHIDQAAVAIAQGYSQAYSSLQLAHQDTQKLIQQVSSPSVSVQGSTTSLPNKASSSIQTLGDISLSLKQLLAHLHKYNQIEGSSLLPHASSSNNPSRTAVSKLQ